MTERTYTSIVRHPWEHGSGSEKHNFGKIGNFHLAPSYLPTQEVPVHTSIWTASNPVLRCNNYHTSVVQHLNINPHRDNSILLLVKEDPLESATQPLRQRPYTSTLLFSWVEEALTGCSSLPNPITSAHQHHLHPPSDLHHETASSTTSTTSPAHCPNVPVFYLFTLFFLV